MANTLRLEIIVDDKGTPIVQKFADGTTAALGKVEGASGQMGGGFEKTWAGIATGVNQSIQLFKQVYGYVQQAVAYMDEGARALRAESSFKLMAESAGVNADSMIASMKRATKETVDDSDLMQKAVKLMLAGYNPEQIERFSKVVVTSSQYAGKTVSETFDSLGDAIANRMPKALVQGGAATREQMKILTSAIENGADSTALLELALANLELKQLMLQGTTDQATIALQRYHTQVKETQEQIGKGLIVVTQKLYAEFQVLAAGTLGLTGNMAFLVSMYAKYRTIVYEAMGDEKKAAENRKFADDAMQFSKDAWGARNDLMEKAAVNMYGASQVEAKATKQEIDGAKAKVDAKMKELKAIADTAKASKYAAQAEQDQLKILTEKNKKYFKMQEDLIASTAKVRISAGESETHVNYDVAKQRIKLADKWAFLQMQEVVMETKIAGLKAAAAKQQFDAKKFYIGKMAVLDVEYTAKVAKELGDQNELNAKSKRYLEDIDQKFRAGAYDRAKQWAIDEERLIRGVYPVTAEEQDKIAEYQRLTGVKIAEDQKGSIDLMMEEYKDTFVGGAKAALLDLEKRQTSWGDTSYAVVAAFAKDAERQLSGNFFNVIKGKFGEVTIDWEAMWNSMLRTTSDYLAKIAVETAIKYGGKAAEVGADWLFDYFMGYGEGAWEVAKDKFTTVHAGEMIIPADEAEKIRAASGPSPGETWGISAPIDVSPAMEHAINAAASSFAGQYGRQMIGKELAGLLLAGRFVNPVPSIVLTILDLARAVRVGYLSYNEFVNRAESMAARTMDAWGGVGAFSQSIGFTGFAVDPSLAAFSDAITAGTYGGGEYGGGGESTAGSRGGEEGAGGEGGSNWRYGGIPRGPASGYWARLHGTEAVIPLPNGRSIPVEVKGEHVTRAGKGGGNIVIEVHYHGTIIEEKKAANTIAELIYPRLKQLEAWGH